MDGEPVFSEFEVEHVPQLEPTALLKLHGYVASVHDTHTSGPDEPHVPTV